MSTYRMWTIASCVWLLAAAQAGAQGFMVLENNRLGLRFARATGTLEAIRNKLTGETYQVTGDRFAVEAVEFRLDFADARLTSLKQQGETLKAEYQGGGGTVDVTYTLAVDRHFAEKQIAVTCNRPYGWKRVVLSRPAFSAAGLRMVSYRYPKYGRKPGEEPTCTFFGRTPNGGFFTGVEVPFDGSSLDGQHVTLAYAPSLKVKAGERLVCEPAYFGVYRRGPGDVEQKGAPFREPSHALAPGRVETPEELPLQSESDAMVAMASVILGPFRFGLVPMACGWHCEMEHGTYTERSVAGDMKSLDFLAECGIDWVSDCHPWGGETAKMNALGANDSYTPGPLVRQFLDHAQKLGVKVVMWSSMNKTHAWSGQGRPFRSDRPDWLMDAGASPPKNAPDWRKKVQGTLSAGGNCLANRPFFDWLVRINLEGMAAGQYKSWAMDGDFFGGGGWYTTVVPVDCQSDKHDHLPGDSNYACQRALAQLTASVRERYPNTYVFMCRPPMDLGIWSLRNVDVDFTLLESGTGKNLAAGDQIRAWSRVRVHRDFLPHYLDQPLLFPSRAGGPGAPRTWPRGNIDYIMLSALSSSPNQLYYLPTKSGIPDEDKAEIRKWLDWGRKNIEYLKVRKDLPDWPTPGKVDGSAHFLGDHGLVVLFNSDKQSLEGQFVLTEESVGLKKKGAFLVTQQYPLSDRQTKAGYGAVVRWPVPPETALILRIQPAE
jgi:hypothetical protein